MATIIKNTASNVSPTELSIARRTGAGSDTIYVVQGGLGGTIDGGGGIDHLVLDQTAAHNFILATDFSLLGIEKVSLGTKGTAGPLTTGSTPHSINASGYTNGLTINGNNGANSITGTAHDDIISGGGGTDTLNGGEGSDTYLYTTLADFDAEKGAGLNDTGTAGTDTVSISATSGTFTLAAFANGIEAYTITGTTGTAGINASAALSGMVLTGGGGANAITGSNFADTISGGGGADNLIGGGGDDTFVYALSTDFVAGEKIDGGAGVNDTILISAPSGLITLSNVVIGVEFVTLTGTGTSEVSAAAVLNGLTITGNDGNNKITGTSSVDSIAGGLGNDTLTGGGGIDVLNGGEGSDTYIYSLVTDFVDNLTDGGSSGTDTVSITATTSTLTLTAAANGIEAYTIAGAGAVSIDASLASTGLTLTGSTGINTLTGTAQADVITGGAGKDILNGGGGDDTFDYALIADYASESIDGGLGTDTIRFSGTTGTLVLGNTLTSVEQVLLAGSSAIGVDAKAVTTNGLAITGNAGNNTIIGTNHIAGDSIDGGAGNDTLTGGAGDDILLGGLGNDTFIVALGTDHGAGETINGQEGTDTIAFVGGTATASLADRTLTLTAGDDVENIFMAAATGAAAPTGTVALIVDASAMTTTGHGVNITGNNGANTFTGSAFGDTLSGALGNDTLSGGDGDDAFLYATQAEYTGDNINGGAGTDTLRYTATVAGTFTLAATTTLAGVEAVALSNAAGSLAGTVALGVDASLVTSALAIYGNAGNNAIRGGTAADTLDGGAGNDIFLIKDAAHHGLGEVIIGGAGTADEIRFDSATIDSTLVLRSGVDASVERAVIGTGTAAAAVTTATTALNIDASAVANAITLIGNNGANVLVGGAGNDTLDGGVGNDLLDGGEGSDTYLYGATTNYGIEESISDFGTSGTDTIQISAASGSLVLRDDTTGIEQVVITGAAAGVDASAVLNALTITGGSGANAIKGTAFADVFTGGAGADNMSGNGGNDVFILNTAAEGTGDVITGGDGYDTVRFLGTGATATTNTLVVAASTNVEEIEISDAAGLNTGTAALNINAAAVTASGIKFTGNAGVNTITGGSGADIIEGGFGNDILNGGGGNDAILVGKGTDHVTGEKIDGGAGTADVVRFTRSTADLTADDTLTLLANTVGIERVAISDAAGDTSGTTALNVNAAAVTVALTITGNDGANIITGTNAADTINAGGGDDVIIVSTAASHGAAEAINGGAGDDTIRYTSTTAGETLTTTGLSNMENIVIGTAGGVTTGTTALNVDASNSNSALSITGNDGVNTLSGSRFDDVLAGNAGNDVLYGASGNDTLDGGAGNDIMNGDAGDDSFRDINIGDQIFGGAGNDALAASTATPDFNLTDLDIGGATTVNLVERIDLKGAGADVLLTFVAADIEAIVGLGGTLVIDANSGDELFSVEDWGNGTDEGAYTRYSNGGVDILVTTTVGFGKTFLGTTGIDLFTGSNSPDTFRFTAATLTNGDVLDGGGNQPGGPYDKIIITGGSLVNFLTAGATISNIEVIEIGDNLDTQLVLENGVITVTTSAGFGNGNNTITLGDGSAAQSVTTGTGNDTINILGTSAESAFTLAAGGGNDTLAINGGGDLNMTAFAGITGIENVSIDDTATIFTANTANLAITAGNGGNTITLGSGTQSVNSGSGVDTINLGSGINVVNTGDGADIVNGALGTGDAVDLDAGNDTYTLNASSTDGSVSGGAGGSDILTIGSAGITTATIALGDGANTTILGVDYSNFDNLAAGAADDALTVTAAAGGSTIDTGSAADNVTAGAGIDLINTGSGTDTVNITSTTYASDTLNGGADSDTLAITGGGTVDMNSATISGFENVSINNSAVSANVFTANTGALAISVTGGNVGATINLGATGTQNVTITGTGNDTVALGSGNNNVNTGGGSDTVTGTVQLGDQVDLDADNDSFAYQTLAGDVRGGAGTDTITIASGAGPVNLNLNAAAGNGNYSGFENISAAGADGAVTATAVTGGSTIDTGSATDNVTAGAGTDLINTGAGNDTINITSGTYSNDTLNGGADSDTLAITGGGIVNISTGVTVSNIENVSINDTATTFTANNDDLAISAGNGGNTITLGTGLQSVTAGTGADVVNLGSGTNNVNTGGGSDTVNGTLDAADVVDLDAGNDTFAYQTLAGDVRGGADSDTITYSGSTAITLDLTATQAATHYSGFENITATGTGAITATASVDGGTINTASGDDIVTLNVGVDTANLGSGNDTITGIGAGDQVTLDDGSDTATYAAAAGALVDAGESVETGGDILNLTSAGPLTINLAASGSNQITGGSGDWRNFENLSAGASGGALTVIADTVGSVITTGSGNDNVTAGGNLVRADNINTGAGTDTINITSGTYAGDTLNGGADSDTLSITGGGIVNISTGVTVSNIENVSINDTATTFTANNDNLAISAGNGGNTITLGTGTQSVTAGTGADTVNLGSGNNNVNTGGGSDTVNGTVAAGDQIDLDAGNDSFAYQTLAGDVRGGTGTDTITIATGLGPVSLNLNVGTGNGNYSGFENISAAGANGAITATAFTGGSTIDTGSAADNVTAGAGTDLINTGAGNDTINITSTTYSNDTLNGGADTAGDTLAITGGGTVDLSTGVTVSNIENVTIDNSAVSANVFTAHDAALTITVSGGNVGANITLGDTLAQTLTITGTGNDTVTLGTGINNVNTGDGSDTVNGTLDATDTVDLDAGNDTFAYQTLAGDVRGGAGTDTITYAGAGPISIDLSHIAGAGFYSGFENVSVTGTGAVTIIASAGGSTIATGSGIDVLTTGVGIDNFDTGAGNDTINITSTTYASDTLNGGADTDTLSISGGGIVNISTGVTVTNFENVLIADNLATTFTANNLNLAISTGDGDNSITLGSGTQSVTSGAGADTVALGGGTNVVNTGGGADSVTGTVGTGDTIDLGAGNDSYAFQTLVVGSSVSGGTDSDTLIYSGSADQVIDFLTTADNIAAEAGTYSNFENLNATTSVGFLNVTAAAVGGTINTGTGNDTITLGAGVDLVNTGAGADTVLGAVGAGDTINLAGADDIFAYQVLVTGATVDGGTSADTLTYAGSDAKIINFTNTTDNIAAEDGVYLRFESLLAAGASGNLTVTAATTGSTIVTGSGNDDITMGAGTDSISTGAGVDVVSGTLSAGEAINLGGDNDNYGYQVTFDAANVIDADAGTGDNLTYTGAANLTINFSTTTDNIGAEAGFYRNFENLLAATATGSYIVTAATTGSTINTGSGSDTITLGAGIDTVNAGGNSDTVNSIGAGDIVSLGDDADTAVYSAVAATVSGGDRRHRLATRCRSTRPATR
jgi:Ca2+-binding RTX toxin-like protein